MKKRLLSLLLTLVMVASMLPLAVPAYALDLEAPTTLTDGNGHYVNNDSYAAKNWGVIWLENIDLDSVTEWTSGDFPTTFPSDPVNEMYGTRFWPISDNFKVFHSDSSHVDTSNAEVWLNLWKLKVYNLKDKDYSYVSGTWKTLNPNDKDSVCYPVGAYLLEYTYIIDGAYMTSFDAGKLEVGLPRGEEAAEKYMTVTLDGKTLEYGDADAHVPNCYNTAAYTDTSSALFPEITTQLRVNSPVYYVYDEKPEIKTVLVNGESVADGATYVSNSKNVTVKTTYDSELSQALQDYGCTVKYKTSLNGVDYSNVSPSTSNGNGTSTQTYVQNVNSGSSLTFKSWLEVTWPDGSKDRVDERTTNVTYTGVKNVSVSAAFSGTPANATSNTSGIKVSSTKWYKWVESDVAGETGYVEMSASDTIKEGALYKCEVTVAEDGDKLASGYTVKINGHEAEKKYGTNHTWVYETRLVGTTSYVDVYDIDLPEAYTNPDFTYNDEEGAAYHWDVVQVEWFECDQDGHILSDALPADHIFEKGGYYRVEVTVEPETNWQFHGSDLGFYINGKAVQYLYYYNNDYSNSVTGYAVYNTADLEGNYELFVYDDSLSGSAKNIYIKDGQYLGSDATAPSDTKPASGGYAYYKDGVLELNGYNNEKAHFIFEELALELYLVGDNTIGAIYDNEWGMAGGNLETRQGNLVIDAADGGKLTIASNPLDAFANIQVKDLYFNGGELTSCLANDTYGAAVMLNGGNLYLEKGTAAYVSDSSDFDTATKWDGTTNISTYGNVWLKTVGTCRVEFLDDDNTVLVMVRVTEGSTVSEPDAPVKEGYEFIGWYTDDGDKFDFSTPITEDITLTAKFEPAASNITVNCIGDIDYTVSGNVVTVDHEVACKVGYLDGTAYKAITAVANGDGTYSFTAPAGVTEVLLVVKGDVSGDGFVTVADKMPVARSLLLTTHPAYQALNTIQTFAGDMDNNGSVIVADKMTLARSMLLTTHPAYQALTW